MRQRQTGEFVGSHAGEELDLDHSADDGHEVGQDAQHVGPLDRLDRHGVGRLGLSGAQAFDLLERDNHGRLNELVFGRPLEHRANAADLTVYRLPRPRLLFDHHAADFLEPHRAELGRQHVAEHVAQDLAGLLVMSELRRLCAVVRLGPD